MAEAVVEVIGPGRNAANARISVIERDGDELFPQRLRRIDDESLERDYRLGARLQRGVAGDLQMPDHLDLPVPGLGRRVGLARQNGASGGLGIDRVAFAVPPPEPSVRAIDLDDAAPLQRHRLRHVIDDEAAVPQRCLHPAAAIGLETIGDCRHRLDERCVVDADGRLVVIGPARDPISRHPSATEMPRGR